MALSSEDLHEFGFAQLVHNGIIDRSGGVPTVQGERAFKSLGTEVALVMFDAVAQWTYRDDDLDDDDKPDKEIDPLVWNLDYGRNGSLRSAAIRRLSELPPRFSNQLTEERRARIVKDSYAQMSNILTYKTESQPTTTPGKKASLRKGGAKRKRAVGLAESQELDTSKAQDTSVATNSSEPPVKRARGSGEPDEVVTAFQKDIETQPEVGQEGNTTQAAEGTGHVANVGEGNKRKSPAAIAEIRPCQRASQRLMKPTEKPKTAVIRIQTLAKPQKRRSAQLPDKKVSPKRPRTGMPSVGDGQEREASLAEASMAATSINANTKAENDVEQIIRPVGEPTKSTPFDRGDSTSSAEEVPSTSENVRRNGHMGAVQVQEESTDSERPSLRWRRVTYLWQGQLIRRFSSSTISSTQPSSKDSSSTQMTTPSSSPELTATSTTKASSERMPTGTGDTSPKAEAGRGE